MTIRKFVLRVFLLGIFVYIVWAGWQIARFTRYESTIAAAESATPPLYELEGAYHMHSRFSDGRRTVDEIARIAAAAKLDFIVFTDHGKPNTASLDAQGRKSGVLVLAGSELSVSRGHLVALGFDRPAPGREFSQNAEEAAAEVHALGGFTVIAHPYAKVRWSWGPAADYTGLELIDGDSLIRRNVLRRLPYYPLLLVKPSFAILKLIDPPTATVGKWDRLLAAAFSAPVAASARPAALLSQGPPSFSRRPPPFLGFFSVDAHFMYGAIFPALHIHALLDAPPASDFAAARAQIFDALRRGAFYNAVDGAASARGFRFRRDGGILRVAAPFSFAHETVIIHDGRAIHRSTETAFALPLEGPGVYRAEVYLRERTPLDPGVPWIVANPIAVAKDIR